MPATIERPLRPHQIEAVESVLRGLDTPPGKRIPKGGLRANVVSACGTGKTMIASHSALRLARGGRILVLLPTLDLLTQTIGEWQMVGHRGPSVAVCSLDDDPGLFAAEVGATTNPIELALRHGQGPVTVYATYASLPVIAEACEGVFGQRLAPFDLAVVDEAHRTSGSFGKAWALIHDNDAIPCGRRLYLTATPRIWQERPATEASRSGAFNRLPEELACSMDDPQVFGERVFTLTTGDAIAAGLLARYQIVVVELEDPELPPERLYGPEKREEEVRGLRLGALQAAMLRTAAEYGLKTMITFHHRTIEAEAFADGIPGMARKLHVSDPERYSGEDVWAGFLHGDHESEYRRSVIREFGSRAGLAILSNCKVLGEGVDIPAVDSVALLDPKGSPVEIVQAIGRALRQKPGEGKLATLIVPVFLKKGERVTDMATSASYRPLVKVLCGLKAHDEMAVEMLAIPTTNTPRNATEHLGTAPDEGEEESRPLVRFSTERDPALIADLVSFQVLSTERRDWYRGYAVARRYAHREGHLLVPYEHRETAARDFPLGSWIGEQRKAYKAGQLRGGRVRRLEALGMVWSVADLAFAENLAAARVAAEEWGGTLCLPRPVTALGRPVGTWLVNCRRPGGLGGDPEKAARRARQLAAVDPDWAPAWPMDWQRLYVALRGLLAAGTALADVAAGVTVHGEDVGRWLTRQTRPQTWAALADGQRDLLTALKVAPRTATPAVEAAAEKAARPARRRTGAAWETAVAALTQYRAREGHTRVPRGHIETINGHEIKLGVWRANMRTRRDTLPTDQEQQLAALGLWD